ncbi:unnamed protein product, partial [Rotaria magnacalcarata]
TKIYSNLADIIQQLGKLLLGFSTEDWNDIRADSVTLVGSNLTITQQTITEKKKSLNNAQVYVRAPSSSNAKIEFVKATIVDEKRNLVKIIDKDITKEPIFFTAQSDHIVYENEPPQTNEQAAGVHAFTINKPYSIDAKTNYLLSMFLTKAPINRYNFISKFFRGPENSTGKSKLLYRLVGKTSILDLAVESRHYFSIGEDADKIYKENETLVTSYYFNVTTSVYGIRQ